MTLDTIQIVDSIASSPTVRLDLNDGTTWRCSLFDAPPPRLRRAAASNSMRDGVFVSSSQYDARAVTLGLSVLGSSEDSVATQYQLLARELDRPDNFLKYQPSGASKPVFFKMFRSDQSQLAKLTGVSVKRTQPTVEILAEPFALGLLETVGPYTVNNDPAAASNGAYVDLTGIIGDVATPCVIWNATAWRSNGLYAMRQHGTPGDMVRYKQAESCTLGFDTTNPGGGPDAAMSGTGTNNYARTSFATQTAMQSRITWDLTGDITTSAQRTAMRGMFRVLVAYRRSGTTSTLTARFFYAGATNVSGTTKTIPGVTSRGILDLGVLDLSPAVTSAPYQPTVAPFYAYGQLGIQAAQTGGSDTIDWDCIHLIPADESSLIWGVTTSSTTSFDGVCDSYQEAMYATDGDPFVSTTSIVPEPATPASGGFPELVPNQTNRLFAITGASGFAASVTETNSLSISYFPRYLYVRPSAT